MQNIAKKVENDNNVVEKCESKICIMYIQIENILQYCGFSIKNWGWYDNNMYLKFVYVYQQKRDKIINILQTFMTCIFSLTKYKRIKLKV